MDTVFHFMLVYMYIQEIMQPCDHHFYAVVPKCVFLNGINYIFFHY